MSASGAKVRLPESVNAGLEAVKQETGLSKNKLIIVAVKALLAGYGLEAPPPMPVPLFAAKDEAQQEAA